CDIRSSARMPSGVWSLRCWRRRSPVEICGMPNSAIKSCACVPLPTPGAPSRRTGPGRKLLALARGFDIVKDSRKLENQTPESFTKFTATVKTHARASDVGTDEYVELPAAAAANMSRLRRKAVIVTHDELRFHLLHRIHRHANDDQQ